MDTSRRGFVLKVAQAGAVVALADDAWSYEGSKVEAQARGLFPGRVSANQFGASPSSTWEANRDAIQAANDLAKSIGGAAITLDPGTYEAKGIVQDSHILFDIPGVTLKNPDGLAPDIITTRLTNRVCEAVAGDNTFPITSGSIAGIEVGTRAGVEAVGGILDSQQTQLTSAIGTITTAIMLDNVTGLVPNSTLLVNDELISFTTITGSSLNGVVRGVNGTTPAAHAAGAAIGPARRLYGTVIAVNDAANTVTLDTPTVTSASGVEFTFGTIGSGIVGFPILDANKDPAGAPSSVYGFRGVLCSSGIYDLRCVNGDVGGVMFARGAAYNHGQRIFLHDCGVPQGLRGSAFWLFQGCEHNHFEHVEVTGHAWVGVYLDDRTSTHSEWDAPNRDNTFVTTNISVTESDTAALNVVSGYGNRFLGGKIVAPRVGINCSGNGQGAVDGTSHGNLFDGFSVDVSTYPWLLYTPGNTLSNMFVKRGDQFIEADGNCLYAISRADGAPPIVPKGYRKNALQNTRLLDFSGWEIPAGVGTGAANGVIDLSDTAESFNPIIYNTDPAPAGAGETWAGAVDVTVPAGRPAVTLRCAIVAYAKSASPHPVVIKAKSGVSVTISAGETKRLAQFMPVTPDSVDGMRMQIAMASPPSNGRRIVIEPKPVLEKDVVKVSSLFDGDSVGALWLGTESDSQSILYT